MTSPAVLEPVPLEFPEDGSPIRVSVALIVSYEQMTCDSARILRDVLRFLNIPINMRRIANAAAESVFERMHERERSQPTSSELLRPGDASDPSSYKVRRGKVGGYRDDLTPTDVQFVNWRVDNALQPPLLREWYCSRA